MLKFQACILWTDWEITRQRASGPVYHVYRLYHQKGQKLFYKQYRKKNSKVSEISRCFDFPYDCGKKLPTARLFRTACIYYYYLSSLTSTVSELTAGQVPDAFRGVDNFTHLLLFLCNSPLHKAINSIKASILALRKFSFYVSRQ